MFLQINVIVLTEVFFDKRKTSYVKQNVDLHVQRWQNLIQCREVRVYSSFACFVKVTNASFCIYEFLSTIST
jgi:hypothetical protein